MFVLLRLVSEIRIGMGFMLNIVASCLKRMHKYKVSNKFVLIAMSVWLCFIVLFVVIKSKNSSQKCGERRLVSNMMISVLTLKDNLYNSSTTELGQ